MVFGALHLGNTGEAKFGAVMAGAFGLLAAFSLWRTGNLWFAIGMHGAWDWGESFFYGVPDSGVALKGHLMNASFHGPEWLTGGTVGPEGSILVAAVLVLWPRSAIHYMFPQATSRKINPRKGNASVESFWAREASTVRLLSAQQAVRFKDLRRCLFDKGRCGRLESPDLGESSGTQ